MPHKRHRRQLLIIHLDPQRVAATLQFRSDPQAHLRSGRPDQLHDHLVVASGRPRQFIEITLTSRCSIRFHLPSLR